MKAVPSRIIDTHQHVFWYGRDDRGLVDDMDAHQIERAWLLTSETPSFENRPANHGIFNPIHVRPDGTHPGIPLSDLLLARDHYPERFVVGYCPHPAVGAAPELLRAAVQMHGVKVCGEWKFRIPFDDPRSINLFRVAGELALPVVLHLDVPFLLIDGKPVYQPNWYGGTVENLERALVACPETTFIGHAPGFWREISGDAQQQPTATARTPVLPGGRLYDLFQRYPNLMADLSAGSGRNALSRDPAHAVSFLTEFEDRLLFGRDYYGQELHQFLQTLGLSQQTIDKIYFQNAERLVK